MRHPARLVLMLAAAAAVAALVVYLAVGRTHRGTGVSSATPPTGLTAVGLGEASAHGYNPFGTGPENRDQIGNLVDNDPTTTWSTETYYEGNLHKARGTGAGFYLDAAPGVAGQGVQIQTPTPGFSVQIYVSNHIDLALPYGDPTPLIGRGWQGPVGESTDVHNEEQIHLHPPAGTFRYYLVWLTTLPPGEQSATIAEVTLFR